MLDPEDTSWRDRQTLRHTLMSRGIAAAQLFLSHELRITHLAVSPLVD